MKRQKIQFLILAVICALCVGGYFLVKNTEFEVKEESTEITVTDFDPEDVVKLTVSGDHSLEFVKEEGGWSEKTLAGENLDTDSLNALLRVISSITTTETVVKAPEDLDQYGLSDPFRTIEAVLSDGSRITVLAGKESSLLGKYYIMLDGSPDVYLISSYIITDFDKTAEEFIQEPETESDTGTDSPGTEGEAADETETEAQAESAAADPTETETPAESAAADPTKTSDAG